MNLVMQEGERCAIIWHGNEKDPETGKMYFGAYWLKVYKAVKRKRRHKPSDWDKRTHAFASAIRAYGTQCVYHDRNSELLLRRAECHGPYSGTTHAARKAEKIGVRLINGDHAQLIRDAAPVMTKAEALVEHLS